jgi:phage gp16-like protein
LGRENIDGLTDLTLGERRNVIAYLSRQVARVKNLFLHRELVDWTSGDSDHTVEIRRRQDHYPGRPGNMNDVAKGPLLKKIEALLAEANRPWSYAHSIAKRMLGIDQVQWCRSDQLHKIVAALMVDARRHGRYTGS